MPIASDFDINTTTKNIRHVVGQTTVYSVNALYTYLLDYIDNESTIQYYVPMSAQTPSEYTLINGWFLDDTSTQFLSSGAIQTSGWNNEIYTLTFGTYPNNLSSTDIGKVLTTGGGSHTGTILDYNNTLQKIWIRKGTSVFANSDNCTITSGTSGTFVVAASNGVVTGETIWSNIFTLGTLVAGTTLDLYQNDSQITPFWSSGHIDILIKVKDASTEIDTGNLTIISRLYGTLYDHYLIDASTGRNPVPLATFADSNNETISGTVGAYTGFTFTFGYASKDLNNGNGAKPYDCVVECNNHTIVEVYEYLKYVTRTGSSTTLNGVNGEFYTAVGDIRLTYSGLANGPFVEGSLITSSAGGTGYIVSLFSASSILVIRNVHGTFADTNTLTSGSTTATVSGAPNPIVATKQAPFGTFAGGQFFGARGLWLDNVATADANKYELIDSANTSQVPSVTVTVTINIVDVDGNAITQNCEITVVKDSDSTVLFHEDDIVDGSTSYQYTTSAGTLTYINVLNVAGYQPRTVNNYTLPSSNSTLNIQLDDDRFYNNPV